MSSRAGDAWEQDGQMAAFLQALLRDPTLAVAVTDATGSMSMMSPALEEMLQVPFSRVAPEEMPEHFNVYTEDGSRMLRPEEIPINRARAGEAFSDALISVLREDGTTIRLRCTGTPIRGEDGAISGGLLTVADVTAERAMLREQKALRDRLVETVNHELRTPLTTLLGHAELLEDLEHDLPAAARFSLDALIRAGNELKDMVQSVSELVDLDAVREVERRHVDVAGLVRTTVAEHAERASAREVVVEAELPEVVPAEVDAGRFRKALAALVENALTYAPAGSTVTVRLRAEDSLVMVDVRDQGPGIPQHDRGRLLQPFERGDQPGQPVNSRGLGLALAHTVAVAHGGHLVLRDNEPQGLCASLSVSRGGTPPGPARAVSGER